MMKLAAAAGTVLLLSACVSSSTTVLDHSLVGAAVKPEQVVIYRSPEQVPGPYKEIALLESVDPVAATNQAVMIAILRERAAKVGANGVILSGISDPGTGARVANALLGTPANRRGEAVAIRLDNAATAQ